MKKGILKHIITMVAVTTLSLSMISCGQTKDTSGNAGDKQEIKFSLWDQAQAPAMEKIAAEFTKENPNITVKVEVTPWDEYWTKLETGAQAGKLPDVITYNASNFPKYVDSGMLEDLSQMIKDSSINLDEFIAPVKEIYTMNDKLYALPRDWDTICLAYNKTILEQTGAKIPTTWDELVTETQKVKDANLDGIVPFYFGPAAETYTGSWNFIVQAGGDILDNENNKSGYHNPANQEAVQFMYDLIDKYKVVPTPAEAEGWPVSIIAEGKTAFAYVGTFALGTIKESPIVDELGIALLPKGKGDKLTLVHGTGTAVAANSKNKDAALKFVAYLATDTANKILAEDGGVLPAKINMSDTYYASIPEFPQIKSIIEEANNSGVMHPRSLATGWEEKEIEIMTEVYTGKLSVADGVKKVADEVDAILQRR